MKYDQTAGSPQQKLVTVTFLLKRVYKSNFDQMLISRENMTVFWSNFIKMVNESKFYKFQEKNCLKWLPGNHY